MLASPSLATISNAAYGTLTQDQINQLKAQSAAGIAQAAAGDTALAQQQTAAANSDINSIVNSWGGVAPSLANIANPPDPNNPFGIPLWIWIAAGVGVIAFVALK